MIEVRTFPELTPRQLERFPALFSLDGGYQIWDAREVERIHRAGTAFVDYHALFATEGNDVLAMVQVIRIPFTSRRGQETVSGLDYVVTRPDAVRRGLASQLIRAVHRREVAAGVHWCFLWTRRSWGAHHGYEKLGYRDVYSPKLAQRHFPGGPRLRMPTGYRWRTVRRSDERLLESLLRRSSQGRLGFVPRIPGSFHWRLHLRWLSLRSVRILSHRGRPVGYAVVQPRTRSVWASDIVVTSPRERVPMLRALQTLAPGRWLVLARSTYVTDCRALLEQQGYDVYPVSHSVLMARPLRPGGRIGPWPSLRAVVRDRRFALQEGDMF